MQFATAMQQASVAIRKPLFFLLNCIVLLLCVLVIFLYREKKTVQQQNRELIIQNDSIMSVNIVLTDSVKQDPLPVVPDHSSFSSKSD